LDGIAQVGVKACFARLQSSPKWGIERRLLFSYLASTKAKAPYGI
jgi:hypothetical protein